MRVIDADALYQEMVRTIVAMMRTKRWMRSDKDNEDEILLVIQNAPTLDYAPVKRGEWERMDVYCNHSREFKCTACKNSVFYDHFTRFCEYDFCPNCGAKMDGKEHEK